MPWASSVTLLGLAFMPWARRPGRRRRGIISPPAGERSGAGPTRFALSIMGVRTGSRREGGLSGREKNASMMLGLYGLSRVVVVFRALREEGARARSSTPAGSHLARLLALNKKIRRAARLERARSRIDPGRNHCKTRA